MGRHKIDWDSLYIIEKGKKRKLAEYPFKQLSGIESRLQRDIKKKKEKIQKLKESIKKEIISINRDIMLTKGDLTNVRYMIKEKSKEFSNEGITILRGGKWVRGKVRIMGKVRWVHIGSADKWGKESDEVLYGKIKEKLAKHFSKDRTTFKNR